MLALHNQKSPNRFILAYHKTKLSNDKTPKCKLKSMSGSDTAKSGIQAEDIFRTNKNIRHSLVDFFEKPIWKIVKAPHRSKSDNIIYFADGTQVNIQNKKIINICGRGDSFDRRHISKTFKNQFIRKYLTLLTLARPTKRTTRMTKIQKQDFINLCNQNIEDIKQYLKKTLIGEKNKNDYWVIMKTNQTFSTINLYIIPSKVLYNVIEKSIHIDIRLRTTGTCLHISQYIALQRKGGSNTDQSPNHIQAKLKITNELLDICLQIL